ncbi:MAG: DNA polymerase-3 subunit gamma/tau, partial [Sphingobacteriales bacterium]
MESFIVSARKYRPSTFNTVVGQEHISKTLKNAIKSNHLAQAFLFCGPRGVGKTTCARILAKTVNCLNLTDDIEPCNTCQNCQSFTNSTNLNIYELDGASNNSVDDIRELIDQVRYPPQSGTHKIYIIDEVHMLSQSAFNAFLKTLEEPPAYAIFILATTEKHKILPTILSRCQVFDFNRITVNDIGKQLQFIATKEGIEAESEALHTIAQKADGAMRDALSIFDQLVSFSGNSLTYSQVAENLNILDYDYYFKFVDHFLSENVAAAMLLFNDVLEKGFDGQHFVMGLNKHLRDLLVCKEPETIKLLEVGETVKEKYMEQSQNASSSFLITSLNLVNKCDVSYKGTQNQRLHVELMLIKLCNITKVLQLSKLPAFQPTVAPEQKKNPSSELKEVEPVQKPAPQVETIPIYPDKEEVVIAKAAEPKEKVAEKVPTTAIPKISEESEEKVVEEKPVEPAPEEPAIVEPTQEVKEVLKEVVRVSKPVENTGITTIKLPSMSDLNNLQEVIKAEVEEEVFVPQHKQPFSKTDLVQAFNAFADK